MGLIELCLIQMNHIKLIKHSITQILVIEVCFDVFSERGFQKCAIFFSGFLFSQWFLKKKSKIDFIQPTKSSVKKVSKFVAMFHACVFSS